LRELCVKMGPHKLRSRSPCTYSGENPFAVLFLVATPVDLDEFE